MSEVVREAIRELRDGRIDLSDIEYRVELREDPQEKSRAKMLQGRSPSRKTKQVQSTATGIAFLSHADIAKE